MKRLALAAVLAAAVVPHRAHADATALAVELSKLAYPEDTYRKIRSTTAEQTRQFLEAWFARNQLHAPADFPARVVTECERIMPSYQEMLDLQTGLLVKHYTEEELGELLAFYRTPLGQKAIRIQPEVVAEVNGQVMAMLQQRMPGVIERLKAAGTKQRPEGATPSPAPAKATTPK